MAVAVWDSLDNTPGYLAMTQLLDRLFGEETAFALQAPFILGNKEELGELFKQAGMDQAEIVTVVGTARFPSIDSWVYTGIKGWTLDNMIDDGQYELLLAEARKDLHRFVDGDGRVSFPSPAHIVTAGKRTRPHPGRSAACLDQWQVNPILQCRRRQFIR
jgi:hypothetical protein